MTYVKQHGPGLLESHFSAYDKLYYCPVGKMANTVVELNSGKLFPATAQLAIHGLATPTAGYVATHNGTGTYTDVFAFSSPVNEMPILFPKPIILPRASSLRWSVASSGSMALFEVITQLTDYGLTKNGSTVTVGGSAPLGINSGMVPIELTHTGNTNMTEVFRIDLGASKSITTAGILMELKTSDSAQTASCLIRHSTDALTWTNSATETTTGSPNYYQKLARVGFASITARYLSLQIQISDGTDTASAKIYWFPIWAA